jgi:predicted metal-dependent peptidase
MANRRAYERLIGAKSRLLVTQPWYGVMAMRMEFIEAHPSECPTMGVRVSTAGGGKIICAYNPEFVLKLFSEGVNTLVSVIQHEIEHVVRLHCVRHTTEHPTVWNIAADMVCNGRKNDKRIENLPDDCVFFPDQWDTNVATEEVAAKLMDEGHVTFKCPMCGGTMGSDGQGQGQGNGDGDEDEGQDNSGGGGGSGDDKCPCCGQEGGGDDGGGKSFGKIYDDHGQWKKSDANKEDAKEIVRHAVQEATSQHAGHVPGHLTEDLKKLEKPSYNWKNALKEFVGRTCGTKRSTHSRPARRFPDAFGMKGYSRHGSARLTIMVDTSGSVSSIMLSHFFAEVEHISWKYKIILVQFDHGVQDVNMKYRRGDWRKIKVKGRGGTCFHSVLDHIEKEKLVGQANIILTDGEAPWPDNKPYPVIWAISNHHNDKIEAPWGTNIKLPRYYE